MASSFGQGEAGACQVRSARKEKEESAEAALVAVTLLEGTHALEEPTDVLGGDSQPANFLQDLGCGGVEGTHLFGQGLHRVTALEPALAVPFDGCREAVRDGHTGRLGLACVL